MSRVYFCVKNSYSSTTPKPANITSVGDVTITVSNSNIIINQPDVLIDSDRDIHLIVASDFTFNTPGLVQTSHVFGSKDYFDKVQVYYYNNTYFYYFESVEHYCAVYERHFSTVYFRHDPTKIFCEVTSNAIAIQGAGKFVFLIRGLFVSENVVTLKMQDEEKTEIPISLISDSNTQTTLNSINTSFNTLENGTIVDSFIQSRGFFLELDPDVLKGEGYLIIENELPTSFAITGVSKTRSKMMFFI
jgi:hypothetical protein